MRFTIGLLTIGQSPREDIVSEMIDLLGPSVGIVEKGALDGLSRTEIDKLKPEKNDFPLITRLKNGTPVVVGKKKIVPLVQKGVCELEKEGVEIVALLCTEDFPQIESRCPLLFPSKILFNAVLSLVEKEKLAIFVPMENQKERARKKWRRTGLKLTVEVLNPYGDFSEMEEALRQVKKERVDLIVLDCIGYTLKTKEKVGQETGKPVLLPRVLLARTIRESLMCLRTSQMAQRKHS